MTEARNPLFGLTDVAKQRLLDRMRVRGDRHAAKETVASAEFAAERVGLPDSTGRLQFEFDDLPGHRELIVQRAAAEKLGIANPFFRAHDGIACQVTRVGERELVNFASYNYLDLSGHPTVAAAAKRAIDDYGTSVSASRVVSGERPLHRALEERIARLVGTEDAVVFVSGHATNTSVIGQMFGAQDLVLYDSLIHNSVVQGALLSGATRRSFPHNDFRALDRLLEDSRRRYRNVLVAVEAVYSMDGDIPDLVQLVELRRKHRVFLMVDEAHSIGVLGAQGGGAREHFGIDAADVDLWMGTLSKSFASCGGYIAAASELVDHVKCTAPGFVYSVGMAPPVAAAALAAIDIMAEEPERVERLQDRGQRFLELANRAGLNTGTSAGFSVVPAIVGSSVLAARLSNRLFERGINVQPILYPAVEERGARLRFFVSCAHTDEQLEYAAVTTARELRTLRKDD